MDDSCPVRAYNKENHDQVLNRRAIVSVPEVDLTAVFIEPKVLVSRVIQQVEAKLQRLFIYIYLRRVPSR